MKTSSCKAKGRRLQKWVAEAIAEVTGIECGKDCLIQSREMGQSGVDVKLIGEALTAYPFSIECKNTETWSVPATIKQAKANQKKGTNWQIFLARNRFDAVMVMDAAEWFDIWGELLELRKQLEYKRGKR
jgi:hypothetical protein